MQSGRRRVSEPGLELRMEGEARRVASQHGRLDELRARVCEALAGLDLDRARSAYEDLAGALGAHFEMEETYYFPALAGCRDELRPEVEALFEEHDLLRQHLDEVGGHFTAGNGFACAVTLDALVRSLEDHERREERLMAKGARHD